MSSGWVSWRFMSPRSLGVAIRTPWYPLRSDRSSPTWAGSRSNSAAVRGRCCCGGIPGGAQIRHDLDAMNELHQRSLRVMLDRDWRHGVTAAVDLALLGRFYERFADHAMEIGRRVIFEATGMHHVAPAVSGLDYA